MMSIQSCCLVTAILLLTGSVSPLSAQLTIDGQIRPRAEYRNGYRTLPDSGWQPAAFVAQRSRFNVGFSWEFAQMYLSLQDVRVWGSEAHLQDIASTAVHEAWANLKFSEQYQLKIGRQELVYDDHRLLGNVNWTQQARSHDAAVFRYRNQGWQLDIGGAFNQARQNVYGTDYPISNYKTLAYLWANKSFGDHWELSALALSDGYETAVDTLHTLLYRYTYGLHGQYTLQDLSLRLSVYGQNGQDRLFNRIFAYMGSVQASYQLQQLQLTAGVDYLSGTDGTDTSNEQNNTFSTLYATNHKFYGFMDYFLNIPKDTRGGGLQDMYLKVKYRLSEPLSAAVHYHYFSLANTVVNPEQPGTTLSPGLGSEVDATVSYQWQKNITFKAGFSTLMGTSSLALLKGGNANRLAHWGWLMVNLAPSLQTPFETPPDAE